MRRQFIMILSGLAFATPAICQTPTDSLQDPPADTEPATATTDVLAESAPESPGSATVAVFKDALGQSVDMTVVEFGSFQTIAGDQLFKQDEGFPQTAAPVVQPAPAPPVSQPAASPFLSSAVLSQRSDRVSPAAAAVPAQPLLDQVVAATSAREFLPADRAVNPIRRIYSRRRTVSRTGSLPPDYQEVYRRWYAPQIPESLMPGAAGAAPEYRVLYLTECWANDVPEPLDAALGYESPDAADRPFIDRARIEVALDRENIAIAPLDPFSKRMSPAFRDSPDPDIRAYNMELLRLLRAGTISKPTLILEKYCGPKIATYAFIKGALMPKYRIDVPPGLTGAWVSPFLFAEICRRNYKTRYYHERCLKWRGIPPNGLLEGLGGYRLVGLKDGAVQSYRFEVKGAEDTAPVNVTLSLEP